MDEKLHTAGKTYKRILDINCFEAARQRVRHIYENFDHVIISWSGGKDSSCCLELCREAAREMGRLPIDVFFLDEEAVYPETIDLCWRHEADPEIKLYWVIVPSIYRNACSEVEPDFIPFEPGKEDLWVMKPPPQAIWMGTGQDGRGMTDWRVPPSIPKRAIMEMWGSKPGTKCMITGLRARESFIRHAGIMSSQSFLSKPDHGIVHGRPIYDWTGKDVWWAIAHQGWDYNKAYDKLWRAGGTVETTRVAPLFHAEAALQLRRVMLYWPDWWTQLRSRIQGVHSMAIYSGALHKPRLLPGETWQQAAERYWVRLGSAESKEVLRAAIDDKLKRHAKHSSAPMHETKRCPKCGLRWKTIARACCLDDRQLRILEPSLGLS
jgi:predicted phosphoadenosine phosphosulfate sulfurtransferase